MPQEQNVNPPSQNLRELLADSNTHLNDIKNELASIERKRRFDQLVDDIGEIKSAVAASHRGGITEAQRALREVTDTLIRVVGGGTGGGVGGTGPTNVPPGHTTTDTLAASSPSMSAPAPEQEESGQQPPQTVGDPSAGQFKGRGSRWSRAKAELSQWFNPYNTLVGDQGNMYGGPFANTEGGLAGLYVGANNMSPGVSQAMPPGMAGRPMSRAAAASATTTTPAAAPAATTPAAGSPAPPGAPAPAGAGGSPPAGGGSTGVPSGTPAGGGPPVPSQVSGIPISEGSGLVNKVWGGFKALYPPLQAAEWGLGEFRSQLSKNDFYRSVSGVSHVEAVGDRVREEWNRMPWNHGLLLNEDESRRLTKGVTALGYGQNAPGGNEERGAIEDAIYEGKRDIGMSVDEGLRVAEVASTNAGINLDSVIEGLENLSEAASEAGVNAMVARKNMVEYMDVALQTGYGSSAGQVAETATAAMTELGRGFQHLDPTTQMTNQGYRYMLAGSQGITLTELNAQERTNPIAFADAQVGMGLDRMKQYIQSGDPQAWDWLEKQVEQRKEALQQEPTKISQAIADEFWNIPIPQSLDRNVFIDQARTFFGMPSFQSEIDSTAYLVLQMAGQTRGVKERQQARQTRRTDLSGNAPAGVGGKGKVGEQGLMKGEGGTAKGGLKALSEQGLAGDWGTEDQTEVTSSYIRQARRTKERSPIIEAMLQGMTAEEEREQFVEVETPSGLKVVHASVAMKHYRNQLESGQARFVGGEAEGKNIGYYTGGEVDKTRLKAANIEATKKGRPGSKKGQDADDFYKEHPDLDPDKGKDNAWKGGTVKIDLTPRAADLVKWTWEKPAESSGEPKRNTNGTSGSRGGMPGSGGGSPGNSGTGVTPG